MNEMVYEEDDSLEKMIIWETKLHLREDETNADFVE